MKLKKWAVLLVAAITCAGCVSIPPESVELAKLTGEMIQSAKISHVNMANQHFAFQRKEIERFAFGEYKAAFVENVTKRLAADNKEMTMPLYERTVDRVRQKANEWAAEVDAQRMDVLKALEEHYTVLIASNEELTSLLRSAVDLSQTRAALLDRWGAKAGISAQKIQEVETKLVNGTTKIHDMLNSELQKLGGD